MLDETETPLPAVSVENASSALLFWFFTKIESLWKRKTIKKEKFPEKNVYKSLDVVQKTYVAAKGVFWTDMSNVVILLLLPFSPLDWLATLGNILSARKNKT